MKNYILYQAIWKVFGAFILVVLQFSVHAQVLSLETTVDKTDIFTRESVIYTFKYSCSGSAQNCTNVTMTGNFPLNTLLITGTTTTSDIASYTISPDLQSITYTFKEPLPSGSTGTIEMTALASSYAANNSIGTLTSSILTGGTITQTNTTDVKIHSSDKFCAIKSNGTGLGLDNTTTYSIQLYYAGTNGYGYEGVGTQSAGSVTVVDQLPAGTIIESATYNYSNEQSGSCTIDAANAKVTCNLPASFFEIKGNGAPITTITIKAKYPSTSFAASQTVTNTASVTYTPPGGSPTVLVDGSTKTFLDGVLYQSATTNNCTASLKVSDVLQAPAPKLKATKTANRSSLKVGQSGFYGVYFSNTGNTDLANAVLEDSFPATIYVASIDAYYSTAGAAGDENIKFWVKTKNNPVYTSITLASGGPNYTPVAGDTLLAFKVTADILHPGFALNGPSINFTVKPTSATAIQNCFDITSTTSGVTIDPTSALCLTIPVLPADNFAGITIGKLLLADPNNIYTNYFNPIPIGTQVWMTLAANNDAGGQALQNPVIMDLLPKGADYAGSLFYRPDTPMADAVDIIPNYNGTGRTLVRLKWNTPIPAGAEYFVSIKTTITSLMRAGSPNDNGVTNGQVFNQPYFDVNGLKNTGYITGTNKQCLFDPLAGSSINSVKVIDTYDLNGNGSTTDSLCYNTAAQSIIGAAEMESIKWVKGQLDTDYSRYPASGNTVRGGKADYKLVVRNTGNVPTKNISIVDILPFVGDHGVIDLSARNSEWRPNLAGPITAPAGVTVYYSTAQSPCRDEMKAVTDPSPFPTGCTIANWTTVPPTDITTVQSLKFDFGSIVVQPGDSLLLTWPMRAPVDAPTNGEIAWNSFGFVAIRTDNNTPLLAAEPIKVGIKLAAPAPAFYGDYVWYDTNHNGLQDTGEQGVDGVKVILYQDNGDNVANPATDTEIAFTITGNGGKYLFPNLQAGNYYAVFFPPTSYSVSPPNQGSDDTIDSDGTLTTSQGVPAYITAITQLDANETDLTWDLGIYCGFTPTVASNSPVLIGGTLSLSASGGSSYSWMGPNNFVSTLPNPTIPNVTTANAGTYKVTVDNNGCYASLTVQVLVPNCVKPNAGTDVRICAPTTSATVAAAANGQTWSAQAGNPTSATITQAGQITGMTATGTYKFILSAGMGCTDTVQVVRGGLSLSITPGSCSTATNQYTLSGTVSLTNAIAGILTITDGAVSTTAAVTTSTTAVSFSLAGQLSGSGSQTVTASLSSCGLTSTTYTAPASCTVAVAISATAGTCNPVTNQYAVSGALSLTNAIAGTATITDGVSTTTVSVSAGATSVPYSLTGLSSGTGSHTVTVSYAGKTVSQTYSAPSSCTVAVALSVTPGSCTPATNQYSISGTISLTNAVAGTATITDGSSTTSVAISAGATSVAYTLPGLTSGTTSHTVTVSYLGQTAVATYTAPASCTLGVGLIITPGVCQSATNQYTITGTLSLTNALAGTASFTDGVISTTVAVAAGSTSVGFSLTGLSSGTGSHTLVASFNGQTQSQTYTAPASCTIGLGLSVTPGLCQSATNQYSLSGTLSLTNAVAGTATVSDGSSTTTVSVAAGATSVAYSLRGLTSDGSSHTVTVSYAGKTASTTYTSPSSCMVGLGITVTPGVCNTATNQYSISGTLSLTNAVAGTATISDGASTTSIAIAVGATSATFTMGGFISDASSHTVTVSYAGKTTSTTYSAPASCTVAPSLALTITAGACNSVTNQYTLSGTISLTNATAGTAAITDGTSTTSVAITSGASSVTFALSGLNSGTGSHTVTVSYANQTLTASYTAPVSCTIAPPCLLTVSVTPGVCNSAANQYSITGFVSATNATGSQVITLSDGATSTTLTLSGNGPASFTLVGLNSDGILHTLTASAASCGLASMTYIAPSSCSIGLGLTVSPGLCQSATNQYSISGTLSLTNAVAGIATISDGVSSTTVSVAVGATSVAYVLSGLTSDGVSHTVMVSYAGKAASTSYIAPPSCICPPIRCLPIVISRLR
ncbi:SdrD B-like domain-containing protein [Spirosoma gilvum]